MVELSIIVCAYNPNLQYLTESIERIKNSSLKNYQIIVIDDGSTCDFSTAINGVENLLYLKTEHEGTLLARLKGIEIAEGKFITFVDADDLISHFYHENMLNVCKEGYDVAVGAWAFKCGECLYYCANDETMKFSVDIKENVLDFFFENSGKEHARYVLWNKIFRADILKKAADDINKIKPGFPLRYGEDVLINYFAFKHAKSVKNVGGGYYFYRLHQAQTVQANSLARHKYLIDCISFVFEKISGENLTQSQKINLLKWKNLLGRDFYSKIAKEKDNKLNEKIKKSFSLDKLSKSKLTDYLKYTQHNLLPENFFEYDDLFNSFSDYKKEIVVSGYTKYEYFRNGLLKLSKESEKTFVLVKSGGIVVPKPKYRLKDKIKHNKFINFVACIIFPKGSRMRKILKKFL